MRRLASVFIQKRSGKSDVSSPDSTVSSSNPGDGKKSLKGSYTVKILPSITTALAIAPSTPQLSHAGQSSGSSSSGSTSLRTPNDDAVPRTLNKKFWTSWVGGKRPTGYKSSALEEWDTTQQEWRPHTTSTFRAPPSAGSQLPGDSDDETSSESESESELHTANTSPSSHADGPVTISRCIKTAYILTSNRLAPPLYAPPLLRIPGSPSFPRSSNLSRFLPATKTLRISMHRKQALQRLERTLSRSEELSIMPFGSRPTPDAIECPNPQQNDITSPDVKQISSFSHGLKRWASRTCFEDRMVVWTANDSPGDVTATHVSGTGLAVAELEFSEAMELLAGLVTESDKDFEPTQELDLTYLAYGGPAEVAVPTDEWKAPYKAVPSPLRMQHGPQISPAPSLGALPPFSSSPIAPVNHPSPRTSVPQAQPATVPVKRGVRFAEDNKDDQIPIGYGMRMRQRREQKEKFLREEHERRALQEERQKLDDERRKREAERNEWEKERKAWDREKRAMEDERKRRLYAGELAAARARRESQRGGAAQVTTSSSLRGEPDFGRANETKRYSRPVYDLTGGPQRQSEPSFPHPDYVSSPHTPSSSESSRPPSTPGSLRNSRPTSIYSNYSSSEDIRPREGRSGNSSKHSSMASLSSNRFTQDRASSFPTLPTWSMSQIPPMPPMPIMPMFAVDMPLLPPTPPFMMGQYPRSRSRNSQSPSPSLKRSSGIPSNHSSENVHRQQQINQRRQSSSSSASNRPVQHGQPTIQRPDDLKHQRRASGDVPRRPSPGIDQRSASHPSPSPSSYSGDHQPLPSSSHLQLPPNQWMNPGDMRLSPSPNGRGRPPANQRQTVLT